jgi:hypothetical protein
MKKITVITFLLLTSSLLVNINAQNDEDWRLFPSNSGDKKPINGTINSAEKRQLNYSSKPGTVTVNQSNEIDSLAANFSKEPFIYGYTIQIEVSQQKSIIQNAKYRMMKADANAPFDEIYVAPNIYLYVGRFYDRLSAYEFRNKILTYFPNSIIIGPKKMDLPPIYTEENSIIAPENNSEGN